MDWEFVGNSIAQIGGMLANTIMDKYKQDQAQKMFLRRFEEQLRIQEPFKIKANDRIIDNMKENVKMQFGLHQQKAEYDTQHQGEMDSFFNSEDLMKEVEKNMASKDEKDILWAKQWQRTSGKIHRGDQLDDGDEAFIESLNSVARANINSRRMQKREKDREHQLKVREAENRNKMLESQLLNYQSLNERRGELTDVDKFNLRTKIDNMELAISQNFSNLYDEIGEESGRKKIWDKKTGEIDPELKGKFLKKNPQYTSRFAELETANTILQRQKDMYKEFFESGRVSNVNPGNKESEIAKAMAQGYSREQAEKAWEDYQSIGK